MKSNQPMKGFMRFPEAAKHTGSNLRLNWDCLENKKGKNPTPWSPFLFCNHSNKRKTSKTVVFAVLFRHLSFTAISLTEKGVEIKCFRCLFKNYFQFFSRQTGSVIVPPPFKFITSLRSSVTRILETKYRTMLNRSFQD
mgnify:CR=1 FL=1